MKVNYSIKEILPKLYCVIFDNQYDMCMTFCRWQEYYESNNPKIKGQKDVSFFDIMKDYAERFGKGAFTYTNDWVGFNLPSSVFDKLPPVLTQDHTPYDEVMDDIVDEIRRLNYKKYYDEIATSSLDIRDADRFYVIAVSSKNNISKTFKHEISHGLFFLNPEYKKEMLELVNKISLSKRTKLKTKLSQMGYADDVIDDEIVAYMATGLIDGIRFMEKSTDLLKLFRKTFRRYEKLSKTHLR